MRKIVLLTLCAVGLSSGLFAQLLTNDGAMLVIEDGATLKVEGGVSNIGTGEIRNAGTLEIQGDFENLATWTNVGDNDLVFSGADPSDVRSGTAVFDNVKINKTAGQNVNLVVTDMTIGGVLSFISDDNKIVLGANDLVIQDAASIAGADDDDYVVTDDVGYLRKEGLGASESFVFPVGYDDLTYNPATLEGNVGNTSDVFSVRVRENLYLDGLAEMDQATEEAVDAMWDITEGTGGGSDVDLTLQWAVSDQLPDFPTEVGISRHDGTNWDLLESQIGLPTGADPRTKTRDNVTEFSAFAVGGEPVAHRLGLDISVFLSGAFNGVDMLRDDLRSGGHVPTGEPYTGLGYSHIGFGGGSVANLLDFDQPLAADDITDWVVVELRQSGTPTNVLATKEGLLQRDGNVVAKDGESQFYVSGLADGNYHVAVRHRNHLGIMSDNALALSATPLTVDFKNGIEPEFDLGLFMGTNYAGLAQKTIGAYRGMWPGDANRDNKTKYQGTANDPNTILTQVLNHPGNISDLYNYNNGFGYYTGDVDLDGKVKYQGTANDPNIILTNVLAYPANTGGVYNYNNFIAQLPQ